MLLHEVVDHVAVGGVYDHHAAVLLHLLHQAHHLAVVDHERTLVRHEGLEAGDALLLDHLAHLLARVVVEIGDSHVEAEVAEEVAFHAALPAFQCMPQALALCLKDEVDDGGGTAVQRGERAGLVVIAAEGAHEGHVQVYVRIDAAGQHELAFRIDHFRARC